VRSTVSQKPSREDCFDRDSMQFSRNAGKYHTGIGMFLCACATFPAGANRHESEICPRV